MALILPMLSVVLGFVYYSCDEYKQAKSQFVCIAAFVESKNVFVVVEVSPIIKSFIEV